MPNCFVFIDESRKYEQQDSTLVAYSAVFISDDKVASVQEEFQQLRSHVSKLGADTSTPSFEFETRDIVRQLFGHKKIGPAQSFFTGVSRGNAERLLNQLAGVITKRKLFSRTLVFHRKVADVTLNRFYWLVKKALEKQGMDAKVDSSHLIPVLAKWWLFGSVNGLCSSEGFKASITLDEHFAEHLSEWRTAFETAQSAWPEFNHLNVFATWPRSKHPDWELGSDLTSEESWRCPGLQLADLVANTTRRKAEGNTTTVPYQELCRGSLRLVQGALPENHPIGINWRATGISARLFQNVGSKFSS